MNDNNILEVEIDLTPTPTPVTVSVENMPDLAYLSDVLSGQSEQLETIQGQVETLNSNTGLLFGVEYFLFCIVMLEILRFVKGLRKKED